MAIRLPYPITEEIRGDGEEPASPGALQRRGVPKSSDERLLDEVFGRVPIPEHSGEVSADRGRLVPVQRIPIHLKRDPQVGHRKARGK